MVGKSTGVRMGLERLRTESAPKRDAVSSSRPRRAPIATLFRPEETAWNPRWSHPATGPFGPILMTIGR